MINQTQVMLKLSYLLGELSPPSSGIDDRYGFIQSSLEEAYQTYPWEFAKTTATITVTSGIATLPSGLDQAMPIDMMTINSGTGTDYNWQEIPYHEQDVYAQSNYRYWREGNILKTVENNGNPFIRFSTIAPQINATMTAPFPDPMPIAQGALRFVRLGENPSADIAPEEAIFQRSLQRLWGQEHRSQPRSIRRSRANQNGHFTGRV